MGIFFLDSSAIVKKYVREVGTSWIISIVNPKINSIIIFEITAVEIVSALRKKERESPPALSAASRANAIREFENDAQYFNEIGLSKGILTKSKSLLLSYKLRAYDSLQLAAALAAQAAGLSLVFIAADNELLAAAVAEGLPTDDPRRHPP